MSGKNKITKRWFIVWVLVMSLLLPTLALGASCLADIDEDGRVNESDKSIMEGEMGRDDCYRTPCLADLNNDGKVDENDEEILKAEFGSDDCQISERETYMLKPEQKDSNGEETVSLPQTRFIDHQDGTVTDPETGLMWTKDANLFGDTLLFQQALTYLDEINEGEHSNFGYSDWRLPTIEELRSLVDYTKLYRWKHKIPEGHPFQNVQSVDFNNSSAITYLKKTDYSWFSILYCRLVGHNVNSCYGYVWPVRDVK